MGTLERRLHRSRVGDTQDRVGRLDVVGKAKSRFNLTLSRETVVQIAAKTQIERPVPLRDGVLNV